MAKDISFDLITMLEGKIVFNYQDGADYYLAAIVFTCTAKGLNARRELRDVITLGSSSATTFTPQQIYTAVKNKMGTDIADKIKDLYIDGINVDISV